MTINNHFKIKWQQVKHSTFMYGSQLAFTERGTEFKNGLMPSGTVIHEWNMMTYYPTDKAAPTLPILKKGKKYQFNFDCDVTPQTGVYFKVIFYRKNKTILDTCIIQSSTCEVTYPVEAFSYKIQMINAAAEKLLFRQITISESVTDSDYKAMSMSELLNEQEQIGTAVRNIIFVEPSSADVTFTQDAIRDIHNVILVDNWCTESLEANVQDLRQFCKNISNDYELHLIGYGPKSNVIAQAIGQTVRSKVFTTFHQDQRLKNNTYPIIENHIIDERSDVSVYQDKADFMHYQHVAHVLNYARYLHDLDVTMLNRGGLYET